MIMEPATRTSIHTEDTEEKLINGVTEYSEVTTEQKRNDTMRYSSGCNGFWYKIVTFKGAKYAVARTWDKDTEVPDSLKTISLAEYPYTSSMDVLDILREGDYVQL